MIRFILNYFFPSHDPDLDHTAKIYEEHVQPDEPQEVKPSVTIPIHTPTPVKIWDKYKPLVLPPILHDFPANYFKYLPIFDREYGYITAEKHIQGFENYLDLFEVEKSDASIRLFALSLQSRAKKWYKDLLVASISDLN